MAGGWKRLAELALARGGAARVAERRNRPSVLILAYHNIVPRGEHVVGDISLHIDQQAFADQLDFVLERHKIIPLTSALEHGADSHRPRVVITFDDAYSGTMTAGIEELKKRGLPATIFVPPGLLGSQGFWWDVLAAGGKDPPLLSDLRTHALLRLQGRGDEILDWASRQQLPTQSLPEHARPIAEEALLTERFPDHITFGAHTWSHPNLAVLASEDVADELERSHKWLKNRCANYVNWLAYPYGLHSPEVLVLADTMYKGALLITGGQAIRRGEPTHAQVRTPRVNVPRGLTLDGLALRLSGVLS